MGNALNKNRVAKNTIFLYIRMLIKLIVSLYTSRVVLEYLGVSDYGIYNVVGGIVLLFGFLVGSMNISVQRFLSFELGRKNNEDSQLNTIFSMAVIIHIVLAIIVFIIAETIGYFLFNQLNIPNERISAALWVFHISIITSCFSFTQIPYTALIVAFERMNIYAYISILEVTLKLLIVFLLPYIPLDRLISYAVLIFLSTVLIRLSYAVYCKIKISQVKFEYIWDQSIFKKLMSFTTWSLLGELSWSAVGQGVNISLNMFFSPVVNAARAIAMQVLVTLNQFVSNFQTAMNPQIIKLYSQGDHNSMFSLTFNGIRLSYYLMLFISFPFLLNINYVLTLWLRNVPEYTPIFCRLAIIGSLCDTFSNLLSTVAKATGKIKKYQIIISFILFLNFPISYLFLILGSSPYIVYIIYIIISVALIFARIIILKGLIGFPVDKYIKQVIFPIIKTTVIAIFIPIISYVLIDKNTYGFIMTSIISVVSICLSIFYWGLLPNEKKMLKQKFHLKR